MWWTVQRRPRLNVVPNPRNGLNCVTRAQFEIIVGTSYNIATPVFLPRITEPCSPFPLTCYRMHDTRHVSRVVTFSAFRFVLFFWVVLEQLHDVQVQVRCDSDMRLKNYSASLLASIVVKEI